jgi:hypothetical protein
VLAYIWYFNNVFMTALKRLPIFLIISTIHTDNNLTHVHYVIVGVMLPDRELRIDAVSNI